MKTEIPRTEQKLKNKLRNTNSNGEKDEEHYKETKLPIGIAKDERMNTYWMKLAGFENLELHHATWSLVPR